MKVNPQHARRSVAAVLVLGVWFALSTEPVFAQNTQTQAGVRAYVDPETGELTAPPPDQEIRPPAQASVLQQGDRGLVEQPAPTGGFMVDLEGRFQAPLIAVPDQNGGVSIQHGTLPETENGGAK